MEIIFSDTRGAHIKLTQIPEGGLFKLPRGNTVYMRVVGAVTINPNHRVVVNLANGNYYEYENKPVIKLEGILTVWEVK